MGILSNAISKVLGAARQRGFIVPHPFGFLGGVQDTGPAAAVVAVQTVASTIADTATTATLTFNNLTDASQCVPFISMRYSGAADGNTGDTGLDILGWDVDVFDDAGTVKCTLTRNAANSTNLWDHLFRVTLVEFAPHITVEKVTVASGNFDSSGERNITVGAVVLANAFTVGYMTGGSSTTVYNACANIVCRLTSTTNVRIYGPLLTTLSCEGTIYTVYDSTGEMTVTHAFAQEINTAWTTKDVTFAAVTLAESLLVAGVQCGNNWSDRPRRYSVGAQFLNTTTVRFKRTEGRLGGQHTFGVQVVKLPGVSVQHGSHTWVSGDQSENKTITAVDTAVSAALSSLPYNKYNGEDGNDLLANTGSYTSNRINLTSSTNVAIDRAINNNCDPGLIGYQVLSLAA